MHKKTILLTAITVLPISGLANALNHCPTIDDFKNGTVCPAGWVCADPQGAPSSNFKFLQAVVEKFPGLAGVTCYIMIIKGIAK